MKLPVAATIACAAWTTAAFAIDADGFRDDFDTLDRERWFVSSGWANGDHQNCLWHESQARIADGILLLSLDKVPQADRAFSCAEVQTDDAFGYGRYEARMKIPFASGVNSNFFVHIGAPQGLPHNEIDFEFLANPQNGPHLQTNYFANDKGGNERVHPVPAADEQFQTYAFEWSADALRWYIDDTLIREETGPDLPAPPQKVYFSIWGTDTLTDWMGPFEYPDAPLVLEIDWLAFTPEAH